jgi:hypothetical protein
MRRASISAIGGRSIHAFLIVAISFGLFWLVWIYGNGLRDPRYLDGWMLIGGMGLQLYFHIAIKRGSLPPKSAKRWQKIHIFVGYLLIAAFISHSNFSLPDTAFEWLLWASFTLVSLSGILGTYLTWSLQDKHGLSESVSLDRIPDRRAELAQEVYALVNENDPTPTLIALPAPPHDAWIMDLYAVHLRDFLGGPRNATAHLIGSKRPLQRLTDEIDNLSRYVDAQSQKKLAAIREMVIEKDRLDFARVCFGLTKGWLLVHVPVTYSLVVLTVVHVLVVYAYSAGIW